MTSPISGPAAPAVRPAKAPRAELTRLAQQLEGVFLNQLFQAMRETIPKDGAEGAAPGQEMFTQFFDERIAQDASGKLSHGLTDALVRQLMSRMGAAGGGDGQ